MIIFFFTIVVQLVLMGLLAGIGIDNMSVGRQGFIRGWARRFLIVTSSLETILGVLSMPMIHAVGMGFSMGIIYLFLGIIGLGLSIFTGR